MQARKHPQFSRGTPPHELDEALQKIYSHYGRDLPAFFRDAHRHTQESRRMEREEKESEIEARRVQRLTGQE